MAILWVLLHQFVVVPAAAPWERVALWPANFGWQGVTLFFVLSGYLITGILLRTRDAPNRVRSFYARRALRILPLYACLLTVVFGAGLLRSGAFSVGDLTTYQAASFWLLLGNWAQAGAGSFLVGPLAVTWSVAIEEQFYLAWPWVVWWTRPARLAGVCAGVIVAVAAARLIAQANGLNDVALYVSTWTRLDALAVGALSAVLIHQGSSIGSNRRALWSVLFAAGGLAAVGDLATELGDATDHYFPTAFSLGPGLTLGAIAAGALLLLAVEPRPTSRLVGCLDSRLLHSFGRYSYGIYLTHGPVRAIIRDYVYGPAIDGSQPLVAFTSVGGSYLPALALYGLICLPVCWAVGWLSYRLIEQPCQRLKARFPARPHSP